MEDEKIVLYQKILERLRYEDGFLIWVNCGNKSFNGTCAGREDSKGYRRIHIHSVGMISIHRLIFLLHFGYLPDFIDHIDGNTRNNRIENLRPATLEENARNAKTPITNTSGRKGVYYHKSYGMWQASIRVNGKLKHIGTFLTFEEACSARIAAEIQYHGEYCRAIPSIVEQELNK